MKITPNHLAQLESLVRAGLTRIPSQAAYIARHPSISNAAGIKDPLMRHRWDAFHASRPLDWSREVYAYANDTHIDTALRAVIAKIGPQAGDAS